MPGFFLSFFGPTFFLWFPLLIVWSNMRIGQTMKLSAIAFSNQMSWMGMGRQRPKTLT